jgi:hypothetical protein
MSVSPDARGILPVIGKLQERGYGRTAITYLRAEPQERALIHERGSSQKKTSVITKTSFGNADVNESIQDFR